MRNANLSWEGGGRTGRVQPEVGELVEGRELLEVPGDPAVREAELLERRQGRERADVA